MYLAEWQKLSKKSPKASAIWGWIPLENVISVVSRREVIIVPSRFMSDGSPSTRRMSVDTSATIVRKQGDLRLATSQAPINSENYTSLGLGKCNQRDWMGLSPVKVFAKIMWTSFKQLRNLKTGKFLAARLMQRIKHNKPAEFFELMGL